MKLFRVRPGKSDMRAPLWMATGTVLFAAGWALFGRSEVTLPPGVTMSDYQGVAEKLRRSTSRVAGRDEVLFNLGVEYATRQRWETAATLFANVPSLDSPFGREARYLQAQSVLQLDRLRESERMFREYLADIPIAGKRPWPAAPQNDERIQALRYLGYLLAVELRFDERRRVLKELVDCGDADLFDTLAFHFQSLMEWNNTHGVERLERACRVSPDDWQMQAVLAQYRIAQGRPDDAWQLLEKCREHLPDDLNIAAARLTWQEEQGDWKAYSHLAAQLPAMSDQDPVLLLRHRGQAELRVGRFSEAAKCFQRALAIDPAHVSSRQGLAEAWRLLEQPDRRKQELAATQALARIQNRLGWAASRTPTAEVLLEIVRLSDDAGMRTAAVDVCRISKGLFNNPTRFERLLEDFAPNQSAGERP
jgi:tetratricopeptide (TPR) repeat protein